MNARADAGPIRAPTDLATGVLFALIGAMGLWFGREWPMGTLAMMDSGFLPRVLSTAVFVSGLALIGRAFITPGGELPGWGWRPLIGVTVAVIAFALTVEALGLAAAILAIVALGSFAGTPLRPLAFVVLWVSVTVMCAGIFIWGVELPLKVFPF